MVSFVVLTFGPVLLGLIQGFTTDTSIYRVRCLPINPLTFHPASTSNSNLQKKQQKQPSWAPPGWVFGPVWSLLYASMGFASFLVYKAGGLALTTANTPALGLYCLQFALNKAWTPVNFGRQDWIGALWIIGALWSAIVATIVAFHPLSRLAACLLLPYLVWVSFASVLSYTIIHLNGTTGGFKSE